MSREASLINSQRYLDKIDKHIKFLQYKLSRVVTTFKEYHILLSSTTPSVIDLIENTPIYCKIETRNRIPPLKLLVDYKNSNTGGIARSISKKKAGAKEEIILPDWKVYASDKNFEPNEINSQ